MLPLQLSLGINITDIYMSSVFEDICQINKEYNKPSPFEIVFSKILVLGSTKQVL